MVFCSDSLVLLPHMLDQFLQSKRERIYQLPVSANVEAKGLLGRGLTDMPDVERLAVIIGFHFHNDGDGYCGQHLDERLL